MAMIKSQTNLVKLCEFLGKDAAEAIGGIGLQSYANSWFPAVWAWVASPAANCQSES